MDGNTAAAEQLAARTKMDCITHTIFLAGGAFLEPIVNGFMRIPFVQRLIGSISGAVWELNNKVIASSELYQRYLLSCLTQYSNPVKLLILLLFFLSMMMKQLLR